MSRSDASSKEMFREAGKLAEVAGSFESLARAALGYGGTSHWDVSRVLRWLQGRLGEIERLVHDSVEEFPTYPVWRCMAARMAAELGNEAQSRAVFDALAQGEFSAVPFDEEWLVSNVFLAETAIALRDPPAASVLYELLVVYADRVATSTPEISIGSVSHYLGRLATALERWEDAERHFDAALELNERVGALPWLARTRREYAELLVSRGAPHERERAEDLRRSRRELADELGMVLA